MRDGATLIVFAMACGNGDKSRGWDPKSKTAVTDSEVHRLSMLCDDRETCIPDKDQLISLVRMEPLKEVLRL